MCVYLLHTPLPPLALSLYLSLSLFFFSLSLSFIIPHILYPVALFLSFFFPLPRHALFTMLLATYSLTPAPLLSFLFLPPPPLYQPFSTRQLFPFLPPSVFLPSLVQGRRVSLPSLHDTSSVTVHFHPTFFPSSS